MLQILCMVWKTYKCTILIWCMEMVCMKKIVIHASHKAKMPISASQKSVGRPLFAIFLQDGDKENIVLERNSG